VVFSEIDKTWLFQAIKKISDLIGEPVADCQVCVIKYPVSRSPVARKIVHRLVQSHPRFTAVSMDGKIPSLCL